MGSCTSKPPMKSRRESDGASGRNSYCDNDFYVPNSQTQSYVDTMKDDLRQTYLSKIAAVQHKCDRDPTTWNPEYLDRAHANINNIRKKLHITEELGIVPHEEEEREDLKCPICFEYLLYPRKIYNCSNGHAFCSICFETNKLHCCSICREDFILNPPRRNSFAERIFSSFSNVLFSNKNIDN